MPSTATWKSGDRVVHTGKPEWGVGTVLKAEPSAHEGKPCQRLSIRFERAGTKTLSTAFAKLDAAEGAPAIDRARDPARAALQAGAADEPARPKKKPPPGMLGAAEQGPDEPPPLDPQQARAIMAAVPEAAKDPFKPLPDRLKATLELYRYTPEGRSLLDWAARQAGVADPLSVFNRHELEQLFDRFRINRDRHLAELVASARRDRTDIDSILRSAPSSARRVLNEINRRR